MKYFRVKGESGAMCGFDSYAVVKAENLDKIFDAHEYITFKEEMEDYVWGWVDDELVEDVGEEEAYSVFFTVREITKEEYEEEKDWNSI